MPFDTAVIELLRAGGGSAVVGVICYLLLKMQIKEKEEDRQWIRNQGEANMVALNSVTTTNKELSDTNAKLVKALLEKGL